MKTRGCFEGRRKGGGAHTTMDRWIYGNSQLRLRVIQFDLSR